MDCIQVFLLISEVYLVVLELPIHVFVLYIKKEGLLLLNQSIQNDDMHTLYHHQ